MAVEGLLGRKLGTTQMFDEKGEAHAVTVLEVGPCVVTQVKTEAKDGYSAIQLGYGTQKRLTKPEKGHLKKLEKFENFRHLREFGAGDVTSVNLGDRFGAELFEAGTYVDVTANSKGRGFQGGVKRHGFHGGPKSHGQSDRHRAPGSIGSGTTPGRVHKGLKMAGQMGAQRVTVRNLRVMSSDPEKGVIVVEGAVPGARNGLVRVRRAKKVAKAHK